MQKGFQILQGKRDLPLVPLRDAVVFQGVAMPLLVQRPKSLAALDFAMKHGQMAFFVAQKAEEHDEPTLEDVYQIGTIAKIKEMGKAEDGGVRVLVEGIARAKIVSIAQGDPFVKVAIEPLSPPLVKKTEKIEALMYSAINQFREVVSMGAPVPLDVLFVILNITDPWILGDLIASNLDFKIEERQEILAAQTVEEKLEKLRQSLGRQQQVLRQAKKLQAEVGKELDKMQKEVFLREQLKAIEKELGMAGGRNEVEELKAKIEKSGMPEEVQKTALEELARMERMPSFSPEISYIRGYLDWLVKLPWAKKDESAIDVKRAQKVLDDDHYGLDKVKERMVEYLSVQKLVGKIRGPILCFVGPPGTGKTSIGKSIARALGRKFTRMSLGGVRDEAEIRGFRRTYVGALPGRIIQGVSTAGTRNPVFMLDEVDKMGFDAFRGDPSAALLEALDPEQNNAFGDHYLEVPFDLSDVMFITTANLLDPIPPALKDRMEVIEFAGYTEDEKYWIAQKFLVPKQIKDNGLNEKIISFTDAGLRTMIREYTLEAGVRELERSLAAVCRKVARKVAENGGKLALRKIGIDDLREFLGPQKYRITMAEKQDEVGVVNGLAWTPAGGDVLHIEATKMPGKGQLILTGQLGKVMQESAQAAYSYARAHAQALKIKDAFYKNSDVHVHVPAGAIPKDGPSAGTSMCCAIVSVLTGKTARKDIAMTGEITLRGKVLEIGGVKEKVIAAHRGQMKMVILPKDNEKDMVDVPEQVKKELKFIFAENMEEVLKVALK
ncbi:endopeptidase La [Candidatus Uhrbacteria bacterium]|nr:endopeptidase La [Candidatus Uhrbacteria bacterium]